MKSSPVGFLPGFKNAGASLSGFSEVVFWDIKNPAQKVSKVVSQEIKDFKPLCNMCKEKVGLFNDMPDLFVKKT